MDWLDHFRRNHHAVHGIHWEHGVAVPAAATPAVVRSLARLAAELLADPSALLRAAAATGDVRLSAALTLACEERLAHGALLDRAVLALGGSRQAPAARIGRQGLIPGLARLWREALIARAFLRALHQSVDDLVLRQVCQVLLRELAGQLAFIRDTLRRRAAVHGEGARRSYHLLWSLGFQLSMAGFYLHHAHALRALGQSPWHVWQEIRHSFAQSAERILLPVEIRIA
jgi:hypothetical protein